MKKKDLVQKKVKKVLSKTELKKIVLVEKVRVFQELYPIYSEEFKEFLLEEYENVSFEKSEKMKLALLHFFAARQNRFFPEFIRVLDPEGDPIDVKFFSVSEIIRFLKENPEYKIGVNLEETRWVCIRLNKNADFEKNLKCIIAFLLREKKRKQKRFFLISKDSEGFVFWSQIPEFENSLRTENKKNCYSFNGFQGDYYFTGFFPLPVTKDDKIVEFTKPNYDGIFKSFFPLNEIPGERVSELALDQAIIDSDIIEFNPTIVLIKRGDYANLVPERRELNFIVKCFFKTEQYETPAEFKQMVGELYVLLRTNLGLRRRF